MPDKYIVSHDMGTSSDKAILISIYGDIVDLAKQDYPIYHPQHGYAEQDPMDWWRAVCYTTRTVIERSRVRPEDIVGITFSSQMQNLIPVDRSGVPLMRSMTWLDSRSADIIRERLWTPPRILGYNIFHLLRFLIITGGSPGHTGKDQIGKMLWLQANQSELFAKTYKFLDAKDFIIYQLTGNMVTSVDVAVIWWLLDTRKNRNRWHPKLCRLAGVRLDQLPEVKPSAAVVGQITSAAAEATGLLPGTPVINGAGDLSAAALGSGAIEDGELHISLGTSGWVAGHFTKRKIDLAHYTGCIGSTYPEKYYLGMAHQETAGVCLEWLKNNVLYHKEQLTEERKVAEIYQVLDQLAEQAGPGANGLLFTPWMFGERCPLDDDYVRAGLFNIGLNHAREHIIRAVFEGIAFNTRWAMETLENLYHPVDQLNMIGGGAKSNIWCQIMADITNRKINRVKDPQQAGAKGMALLASMTLGYIPSYQDIKKYIKIDRVFTPDPANRSLYDRLFREFKNIYKQNKRWYKRMNAGEGIR
ncbi:MAG: FGGY-family carbohydrate kinase [candidate division KSB1 bacterium]|nr:FGGY-family carbohydrate kinase [candidate division KSB1 bacterium]